jgi:hypothetical protein
MPAPMLRFCCSMPQLDARASRAGKPLEYFEIRLPRTQFVGLSAAYCGEVAAANRCSIQGFHPDSAATETA